MNRADRRRLAKKGNAELFAAAVRDAQEHDVNYQATRNTLALVCLILRDRFGFADVRLRRMLEGVADYAEAVNEDRVKISEIVEQLKEEVPGIAEFWGRATTF